MIYVALVAFLGAFVASAVVTPWVRRMAIGRGFVDRPGGHKGHDRSVALGGGIAITWVVCLPVLAATTVAGLAYRYGTPAWFPEVLKPHVAGVAFKAPGVFAVMAGAIMLHIIGLVDDRRPLGPTFKFFVQVVIAFILAAGFDIRILDLAVVPAWCSVILTVLWITGITNAFNFLDNMDGLSAGVAAISGIIFSIAAFSAGQLFVPMVMLLLVGALLGFLIHNFHPASIFMGDSGSLVVGYLMAVLIVLTTFYDPRRSLHPAGVLLPIVVLAVPLYDVVSVCVHRYRAGASLFQGDRRHFSHRLVQRGFSTRSAVLTIYLATAATSASAILLPHLNWLAAGLIFAQCLCVVLIIAVLEHRNDLHGPP